MRPDWHEYFLGIAEAVSLRSDCERSKVGAVVVKDRRIRATGYNGSPAGQPGCATCPRRTSAANPGVDSYDSGATRCVAVHAEANALLYCDREDLVGATLYITRAPCPGCLKLIEATGLKELWWPELLASARTPQRYIYGPYEYQEHFAPEKPEGYSYTMADIIAERQRRWGNVLDSMWTTFEVLTNEDHIVRGEN